MYDICEINLRQWRFPWRSYDWDKNWITDIILQEEGIVHVKVLFIKYCFHKVQNFIISRYFLIVFQNEAE